MEVGEGCVEESERGGGGERRGMKGGPCLFFKS